ncbi:STAS-like domain-containing protein [Polaribacter gochangensis]|uniref:STAS-like domain-containing protein n=1 Tax=Polaribacter gochangensis TaxID=3252903 RepID=UPI003904683A
MESIEIKIAKDFSFTPGPRYIDEGKNSGEKFRKEVLYPKFKEAIETNKKVIVDLDGTAGYGTSFLEESFGGLIRINKLSYKEILKVLTIITEEEDYLEDDVYEYLNDAHEESAK